MKLAMSLDHDVEASLFKLLVTWRKITIFNELSLGGPTRIVASHVCSHAHTIQCFVSTKQINITYLEKSWIKRRLSILLATSRAVMLERVLLLLLLNPATL